MRILTPADIERILPHIGGMYLLAAQPTRLTPASEHNTNVQWFIHANACVYV
jgi:hypothetical protein